MDKNIKTTFIIGGLIVAVLVVMMLIMGSVDGWHDDGYGMMGGSGWFWFMPVIMVAFWGLVIWIIVSLVRGVASPGCNGSSHQADSALEIIKRRYALGEISQEEFEEKKKHLV